MHEGPKRAGHASVAFLILSGPLPEPCGCQAVGSQLCMAEKPFYSILFSNVQLQRRGGGNTSMASLVHCSAALGGVISTYHLQRIRVPWWATPFYLYPHDTSHFFAMRYATQKDQTTLFSTSSPLAPPTPSPRTWLEQSSGGPRLLSAADWIRRSPTFPRVSSLPLWFPARVPRRLHRQFHVALELRPGR